MEFKLRIIVFLWSLKFGAFSDLNEAPCIIDLECRECIPDNMPLVESHRAAGGSVRVAAGDELRLGCGGGKFLAYPLRSALAAVCEAGRYRVRHDAALRHLLELGCQENIFEDVLHEVDHCGAPLQGRAYRTQGARGTRHLATLCFDADRAVALRARATSAPRNDLPLRAHSDRSAPLSILGNFNHMFDAKTRHEAEILYSDDARMTGRVRELMKHDRYEFAEQTLTSAKLLSGGYFEDQNMRVTDFASNEFAAWSSVARGNLRHAQRDVARALRAAAARGAALDVFAGTRGELALRAGAGRVPLHLRAGRRFPVPEYVWTAVLDPRRRRGVAIVVRNDPFVAVSEIKDAVFCESACGGVSWLRELKRNRNYETPIYGLTFCCSLQNFTKSMNDMPADVFGDISGYEMLNDLSSA